MKKINQYKLLVAFCILPCWASCDYEEVNTNPYEVTDEEANRPCQTSFSGGYPCK